MIYFFSVGDFFSSLLPFLASSFLSPFSPSVDAVLASPSVPPSAGGASPSTAPSVPSAASAGFSGSLIIVGAASVATTKSLP